MLFFLPPAISIGHAGLAQIFFCLTLTLALVTSPGWKNAAQPVDDPMLRRIAALTTALVYTQILIGATMRHNARGPGDSRLPAGVRPPHSAGVERRRSRFTSRTASARSSSRSRSSRRRATCSITTAAARARPARAAPAAAVRLVQVTLGAFVVWSGMDPVDQHRARRERRAGARHVARAHAALRSGSGFERSRCSRSGRRSRSWVRGPRHGAAAEVRS